MNPDVKNNVYELFADEIQKSEYMYSIIDLMLIYKHELQIDSYKMDDSPFEIFLANEEDCGPNEVKLVKNRMIIGGRPIGDQYKHELLTAFINSSLETHDINFDIYVCEENRITQITSDPARSWSDLSGYYMEKIYMAVLTKLLPWFFKDIDADGMEFVRQTAQAVIGDDGHEYIKEEFERVMNKHNIITKINRNQLESLGKRLSEKKVGRIKCDIADKESDYNRLYHNLMDINASIIRLKRELFAIESAREEIENPVKEIIQFLDETSFDFRVDSVTDSIISIKYRMPITVYDTDEEYQALVAENTGESYFFHNIKEKYSIDQIKAAYKRIMHDKDCIVWCSGKIVIDMEDNYVRADNTDLLPNSGMHPHLNGSLSCFGTAERLVRDMLIAYRLYEFMNQMAYCTQQFTMSDIYAGAYYVQSIRDYECIECPDGKYRRFDQLIEAIDKEEI